MEKTEDKMEADVQIRSPNISSLCHSQSKIILFCADPSPIGPPRRKIVRTHYDQGRRLYRSKMSQVAGSSEGITIYAVFVLEAAGEVLLKYIGDPNMEFWLIPSFENTAWSVMAISFISLLAICAVLATCFFVRRHRLRHVGPRLARVREFHGMSGRLVKALPSLIFSSVADDNCTSETCAICLEDYTAGEKLRVLPCRHRVGEPPASENTPLLSSTATFSTPISSVGSAHSSLIEGSPAMQIPSSSLRSQAASSSVLSYSGTSHNASSYMPQSFGSCRISPVLSRNSINIGNALLASRHPSLQSLGVQASLFSRHSSSDVYGVSPQLTPQSFDCRYAAPFISGSCSASPQIGGSRSRPPRIPSYGGMPSYGGSLTSITPFASTKSLPGYQDMPS